MWNLLSSCRQTFFKAATSNRICTFITSYKWIEVICTFWITDHSVSKTNARWQLTHRSHGKHSAGPSSAVLTGINRFCTGRVRRELSAGSVPLSLLPLMMFSFSAGAASAPKVGTQPPSVSLLIRFLPELWRNNSLPFQEVKRLSVYDLP